MGIWQKKIGMVLYAGYQDVMPLIFQGWVNSCISYREGGAVDWITEIQAFAGGEIFVKGYANLTAAEGTRFIDLLNYLIKEAPDVKLGYISPKIPPLKRDTTFIGQTMDLLGRAYGEYNIYIDKGELNVLGKNEVVPGEIQVITDDTGLLGSPRRANLFVEVNTIFEPGLRPGQAISILSSSLPELNQAYQINDIKHNGIISPTESGTLITSLVLTLFPTDDYETLEKAVAGSYTGTPTTGIWQKPVKGIVSSPFGWRMHPIKKVRKFHYGMDIGAPAGTPVFAPANGTVIFAGTRGELGKFIEIDNGEIKGSRVTSGYAHLQAYIVHSGQTVSQGQVIGYVGSTGSADGPHLHFITKRNNTFVNPVEYIGNYG